MMKPRVAVTQRHPKIQVLLVPFLVMLAPALGLAQSAAPAQPKSPSPPAVAQSKQPATHITPEQARQLFGMVDELLKFASEETGLPIKSEVRRKLTTRAAVEIYLRQQMNDDQDAKRFQRSELVLKKFGLLDRDFDLKPFLLQLLGEQIEAYYDPKTKTVNLLDWISPDQQKPVLAHELTHALQDQHVGLVKWSDQTPLDVSTTYTGDNSNIQKDEMDTAREAVTEGQATAVMIDNMLKPRGLSLIKNPETVEIFLQHKDGSSDSPILARAPLLISESLMFPYKEGLSFEQDIWMDKGRDAAFSGALDHPPSSSWEIINPRDYEQGLIPPVPLMPNIHPLLDPLYRPYDIGQVGQLDVKILTKLFGGDNVSRDITPAWDGGIYWAGQLRTATPAERATTKSIAIFYLSRWKNSTIAAAFAHLYAMNLGNKYSALKEDKAAEADTPANDDLQQVFSTEEGPVVITTRNKSVFVSESFPLPLARKLTELMLDSQSSGALKLAALHRSVLDHPKHYPPQGLPTQTLSAGFVRFFAHCGVMKAAVDASLDAASQSAHGLNVR